MYWKYLRSKHQTANIPNREERNALNVSLWSQPVFKQKVDYIHLNPVVAGICKFPEEYKYSSASFYLKADTKWPFLTHYTA